MYYFTEQDPNYRIQGSRDPLGFQVIWQKVGRNLIKYLSTVSSNIRDFQTLSYAKFLYGDRDPKGFNEFFLKFEQVCAYARGIYLAELKEGFNGTEFINKNKNNPPYSISLQPKDTILSNQRVYGIWGKYNRPYNEMDIERTKEFSDVMNHALNKGNKNSILDLRNILLRDKISILEQEQLKPIADILRTLTKDEQNLYREYILKVKDDQEHIQNQLYNYMIDHKNITSNENLDFYSFTNEVKQGSNSNVLRETLNKIQYTDKVLSTHLAVFRTLQSEPSWTRKDINNHKFLSDIPGSVDHTFSNESDLNELNSILNKDIDSYEKVKYLVERNSKVCKARNNSPWIQQEGNKFKVYYGDGAQSYDHIDRDNHNEFDYFLGSYYRLFKHIEY